MMYCQLTCASYYSVEEWEWLYKEWKYTGDYSFIFLKIKQTEILQWRRERCSYPMENIILMMMIYKR